MQNKRVYTCFSCGKTPLSKDEIGINKKLLDADSFFCLNCLADYLETDIENIMDKIDEFKEQGCELFS